MKIGEMIMLAIVVENEQGATDSTVCENKGGINRWMMDSWSDTENLRARVTDENGHVVGGKNMGDAGGIKWLEKDQILPRGQHTFH